MRRILEERVGAHADGYGIVVGLIDASGSRIVGVGHPTAGDARTLDGDSLFEIGSLTKVFTARLLAIAVERGEVALDDPAQKFLPATLRVPQYEGRPITLRHLATHTSGLPNLPEPREPKDWQVPSSCPRERSSTSLAPATSCSRRSAAKRSFPCFPSPPRSSFTR